MSDELERLAEARKALQKAWLTGTLRKSKNPPTVEVPFLVADEAIEAMLAVERAVEKVAEEVEAHA